MTRKEGTKYLPWLRAAAAPERVESVAKETVSCRIDKAIADSLRSMANELGKPYSRLLAEIVEPAVREFDQALPALRPDLLWSAGDTVTLEVSENGQTREMAIEELESSGCPGYSVGSPRWLTVEEAYRENEQEAQAEDLFNNTDVQEEKGGE